jgi:hypothetical protein
VVVATTSTAPQAVPPASPGLLVVPTAATAADAELVVPPDVVVARPGDPVPRHEVIGRAPTVVSPDDLLPGPLDEGVLNPAGFVQRPERDPVDLVPDGHGGVALAGVDPVTGFEPGRGATARHVATLRPHEGVRVRWAPEPAEQVRLVAGLAMAGVPLVSGPVPPEAARLLGAPLADALTAEADLTDRLRREEHSVRLRRAALLGHSTLAWRARLAAAAGLRHQLFPTLSVVLATRRPEQLEFALAQVARQRGVVPELVLAAHGFEPDESRVRAHLGDAPYVLVPRPAEELFGDVLQAGVHAASGELVCKMDDDDWYGPDFLADLLLARHYSGADVVGTTAEFVYLEELDRTVRRTDDSERAAKFVAGGTMLMERGTLLALGGFRPVRRFVDASLLAAVHASGGSVYRSHGLGYVLRRSSGGHTWQTDLDYFLDEERLDRQWPGFVPSRLLEPEALVPTPAAGS